MMKYIRTRDGRIIDAQIKTSSVFDSSQFFILNKNELVERYPEEYGEMGMWCCRYRYRYVGIVDKQADTIEELCDEFIVISDNCERPIISALPFNELKLYAKNRTKYATCYGAIWTEKGLIYVAKMNEKGELKLL